LKVFKKDFPKNENDNKKFPLLRTIKIRYKKQNKNKFLFQKKIDKSLKKVKNNQTNNNNNQNNKKHHNQIEKKRKKNPKTKKKYTDQNPRRKTNQKKSTKIKRS